MLPETQREIELLYSESAMRAAISREIYEDESGTELVNDCVKALKHWANQLYYPQKDKRILTLVKQLREESWEALAEHVIKIMLEAQGPISFGAGIGALASRMTHERQIDRIKTAAEVLGVLAHVDMYDVEVNHDETLIIPLIEPSSKLRAYQAQTQYLPPLICPPNILRRNTDTAYMLPKSDSVILGGEINHHEGNVCLDSLNRFNQIPLSLNVELLKTYSEQPKQLITDPEKEMWWKNFVKKSYVVYRDLIQAGNEFYLTHKVDKRGRTYAQGYHCSTQGNSFRKAIVELAEPEIVEV